MKLEISKLEILCDPDLTPPSNYVQLWYVRNQIHNNERIMYTAVSRKVVQQKSIKAYATIPKGMMGCGCSLLHRQVHEFSARWKAVLSILVCVC